MSKVKITVERLTSWELAAECARVTIWKNALGKEPSDNFKRMLVKSEHSPLRTLLYKVRMENIPSFVSVHFVRHKCGVEHFVSSNRPDRNGGNENIGRWSPVNHVMVVNAQELLFMARRRLCSQASRETRWTMKLIIRELKKIDPILANFMMPMCAYRGGFCPEPKGCGHEWISGMIKKNLTRLLTRL